MREWKSSLPRHFLSDGTHFKECPVCCCLYGAHHRKKCPVPYWTDEQANEYLTSGIVPHVECPALWRRMAGAVSVMTRKNKISLTFGVINAVCIFIPGNDYWLLNCVGVAIPIIGWLFGRNRCADCGVKIGYDKGPKDGWQLEDGRTVCNACCLADWDRVIQTVKEVAREENATSTPEGMK